MYNNDYLEKILGEQYNMSNYFENTYTEPNNIIENSSIENFNDTDEDSRDSKKKAEKITQADKKEAKLNESKENNTEDIVEEKEKQIENIEMVEMINLDELYPETFKVINPIVELVVKNNIDKEINEELIKNMTDKIYYAVETDANTNEKENAIKVNARPHNSILYDLIKILLLNNIINNRPMPPHHYNKGNRPPIRPRPRYHDIPFPEDQ